MADSWQSSSSRGFPRTGAVCRSRFFRRGLAWTRAARARAASRRRACEKPREQTRMSPDSRKRTSVPAAAEAETRARATGTIGAHRRRRRNEPRRRGSLAALRKWCVDRVRAARRSRAARRDAARLTRVSNAAFASADVRVGDVLVDIPKAWCLTPRTGSRFAGRPGRGPRGPGRGGAHPGGDVRARAGRGVRVVARTSGALVLDHEPISDVVERRRQKMPPGGSGVGEGGRRATRRLCAWTTRGSWTRVARTRRDCRRSSRTESRRRAYARRIVAKLGAGVLADAS